VGAKLGRNDPCHCGSGKKYKACHLEQDEAATREAREKEAAARPAPEAAAADKPKHTTKQPWRKGAEDRGGAVNTHGFTKTAGTRKVGSS
jgi:hypothetical protein